MDDAALDNDIVADFIIACVVADCLGLLSRLRIMRHDQLVSGRSRLGRMNSRN
jgi:hypothetical protein